MFPINDQNKNIKVPNREMHVRHQQRPKQDEFGAEPSYQINTGKVIKGHKLTMKDLIQKQRIKSKNSSPTNKQRQFQQFDTFTPKITDFCEKYKGLQTLDDEESLYRFITYQREKQSRESARGIKLFSCQKRGESFDDDSYINNHISFSARNSKTSQSHRRNASSAANSHNKTISYENQSLNTQNQITFMSDNLGKRMNEYLNIILQKKEKAEMVIKEDEIKEEAELYKLKHDLINQVRVINKQAKNKSNTFYRQMKKTKKNRILSAQTIASESMKSNQLVKSLMRKTAKQFEPKTPMNCERLFLKSFSAKVRENKKNQQSTSKSFYSKQQSGQKDSSVLDLENILTLIYKE